jgi:hypothetical protein
MSVPFLVVACLFFLKLLSNVLVPISLARRPIGPKGEEPGVSLMPYIEVLLLLVLVALSALGLGPYGSLTTVVVGIGAIVGSYALMVIVAATISKFSRNFGRR